MKKIAFVALLGLLMLSGCMPATVPLVNSKVEMKFKEFKAPHNGMAGIYVYRKDVLGSALTKSIWIDKKCVGDTATGVFFYKEVAGNKKHTIATESEFSPNELTLYTKANHLYFIEQFLKMGVFVAGADLTQNDTKVGEEDVRRLSMAKEGTCSATYETKK